MSFRSLDRDTVYSTYKGPTLVAKGHANTNHLMEKVDVGIRHAMKRITTKRGTKCRSLYKKTKWLKFLSLFMLVSLTFFEVTSWCIYSNKVTDMMYCNNDAN